MTADVLTVGAPTEAVSPWYVEANPSSGKGFEAALVYELAAGLGYAANQVTWVQLDRGKLESGTAAGFDITAAELVAPDVPGGAWDYSTGYLAASDAIVVSDPSLAVAAADPKGLAALKVGIVTGSPASATLAAFSPEVTPQTFTSAEDVLAALGTKKVDVAAVDLVHALESPAAHVVGLLPTGQGQSAQLGFALPKGSALTGCVSSVLDSLRADGTLERLTGAWIGALPVLKN